MKQEQHGQEYQLASNFIDLNAMTVSKSYPAPDLIDICYWMSYSGVFMMVDIKSGFFNILVTEQTKQYLGIVT